MLNIQPYESHFTVQISYSCSASHILACCFGVLRPLRWQAPTTSWWWGLFKSASLLHFFLSNTFCYSTYENAHGPGNGVILRQKTPKLVVRLREMTYESNIRWNINAFVCAQWCLACDPHSFLNIKFVFHQDDGAAPGHHCVFHQDSIVMVDIFLLIHFNIFL